jgi:UDP-N-acetylmuramate dehydrogenase
VNEPDPGALQVGESRTAGVTDGELAIEQNVSLAPYTTLGVGGVARWFCRAENEAAVAEAVDFAQARALPMFVLGGGSNLLVSDAGFPGLVLKVAIRGVATAVESRGTVLVEAGAGEPWDALVRYAVDQSLAGIECLAGIPGDVGGTPVQNVGAYGQEVAETIVGVRAYSPQTREWVELSAAECGFSYRRSIFNSTARERYIVTAVRYRLKQNGVPSLRYSDVQRAFVGRATPTLREVYDAVREIRAGKGMLAGQGGPDSLSAGSFFKNPVVDRRLVGSIAEELGMTEAGVPCWPAPDGNVKISAAWLIERAGFPKGFMLGRAGISTRHTLALVNCGGATAAEIIALRDAVAREVETRFGVRLEQEPVLLGF